MDDGDDGKLVKTKEGDVEETEEDAVRRRERELALELSFDLRGMTNF